MSVVRPNPWHSGPSMGGDGLFHRCHGGSVVAGAAFLALVMLAPPVKRALSVAPAGPRVASILFTPSPVVAPPPAVLTPLGGTPGLRPGLKGDGPPEGTGPKGPLAAKLGPASKKK